MPPMESVDHEYQQTRFEQRHSDHSCAVNVHQQHTHTVQSTCTEH